MSEQSVRVRWRGPLLAVLLAALLIARATADSGPIDAPTSTEPRVAVAKALTVAGTVASQGTFEPFARVLEKDTLYSRDLLVALPGFQARVQPTSKAVVLTLWGNMPGLSDSPV